MAGCFLLLSHLLFTLALLVYFALLLYRYHVSCYPVCREVSTQGSG